MKRKVLLLGASGSGKTTALQHITPDENIKILRFDYKKAIINNNSTYLFSSPSTEGFKLLEDVITDEIDGIIVVIDNSKGISETDTEITSYINKKHIPYIIFANKQDLNPNILKINFNVIIIPTIALDGIGVSDGLKILLNLIKNTTNEIKPKDKFINIINGAKSPEIEADEKPELKNIIKKIKPTNKKDITTEICKLKLFMHPIELENVKTALEEVGFSNITVIEVGYVDNHSITHESYRGSNYSINIPQKVEINMVIKREDAQYVFEAIKSIKTEDIHDEIFISPIKSAIRIRTGERGGEAIE
ncbi:MAG: hypothetical protein HZC47_11620 [Methanobacterium sp.]|uniref:P-II family nitrogen regulator n=1 Tax=Methanobacterium sp. TaxID=2164 RepID=UPI003D646F03|nr:hypothetical protein [Methanobacterium sp.]